MSTMLTLRLHAFLWHFRGKGQKDQLCQYNPAVNWYLCVSADWSARHRLAQPGPLEQATPGLLDLGLVNQVNAKPATKAICQ